MNYLSVHDCLPAGFPREEPAIVANLTYVYNPGHNRINTSPGGVGAGQLFREGVVVGCKPPQQACVECRPGSMSKKCARRKVERHGRARYSFD